MMDRDLHRATALVVDGNDLLRSVTVAQLRTLGVGQVSQAARLGRAREMIEQQTYDIIVCNREFDGQRDNGQDLLDELRREQLLPHSTVFVMVTSQATYHQVVEAAESALDAFLLRPFTEAALAQKLADARHRKRELAGILSALDRGDTDAALARALHRFQNRLPYAGWCGRLVAELLLQRGRTDEARRLFERLAQGPEAGWARLGVARACLAAGDVAQSRRLTEALLAEQPDLADAHELLARIALDTGDVPAAGAACRRAVELTPGCLVRLQHAAALTFHEGRSADARALLESARALGQRSKLFDPASLLLLAWATLDAGDRDAVTLAHKDSLTLAERRGDDPRARLMADAAAAARALAEGDTAAAVQAATALLDTRHDDGFGMEAAQVALGTWARLPDAVRGAASLVDALRDVALRHCTTKSVTETLVLAARRLPQAQALLHDAQSQVAQLAETSMDRALTGDPAGAVTALLDAGEAWRNARLLELAGVVLRRHAAAAADADAAWVQRARAVQRAGAGGADVPMIGVRRQGRSPGGLQLRGRAAQAAAPPVPLVPDDADAARAGAVAAAPAA